METKPFVPLPPPSNVPMALKIEGLKALESGVSPEDLPKHLAESGAVQKVQEEDAVAEEDREDNLYRFYLLSYLRLKSGQIENLSVAQMEDVAHHCEPPRVSFEEWKRKAGV